MVHIEIDGKKVEARQGQMIIEAADQIGIAIPRFCYHKKLSIAANCRMCLVEVGNAPKPLPACATPVSEGMKVFTQSIVAKIAQKAVMEFLLINHPLDCPVCDQGGQCELQDVALEYGNDFSRYAEGKRSVKDKNIGPLIATEMTRCIHCTRCVRFGTEIAGVREMGATGRGEFMEIGTYIEKSIDSELSGNVIDLCPVGALTSKPFRFEARAWELQAAASVSPHDCLGSNLFFHTLRDKVMRTLPRENENINEVWLSDRDRFSYEGFNHADRLQSPEIRRDGKWEKVDWATALSFAVEKLKTILNVDPDQLGALASPNSTLEEFYLLQKLLRAKGCYHIDHRLRQSDYRHQSFLGSFPQLGIPLSELETQNAIVVIGSDVRKEQPLISHRLRKASLHGAKVIAINAWKVDFNFDCEQQLIGEKGDLIQPLLQIIKALEEINPKIHSLAPTLMGLLSNIHPSAEAKQTAHSLISVEKSSVILGAIAITHPEASFIFALSRVLATFIGATWGEMTDGANSAGGWLAGAVPHRLPMGKSHGLPALGANEMWLQPRRGYLLLQCEPEYDCADPRFANEALKKAEAVIVLTAFDNPHFREYADVLLPVTPISEMAGTYVNAFGEWQNFQAAVKPLGESRPAWKVLRVFGNLCEVPGFNYEHAGQVLEELIKLQRENVPFADKLLTVPIAEPAVKMTTSSQFIRLSPTPLYAVDGVTRRAEALQATQDAQKAIIKMHSADLRNQNLQTGQKVWIKQDSLITKDPLLIEEDDSIPVGAALVAASIKETKNLGAPFGLIELIPFEDK
ncbi:MAG: NADH-quinone oxidoreductase subunit NuoG [Candidatus Berkiellales bacterium]